jgi:hypothetical protein
LLRCSAVGWNARRLHGGSSFLRLRPKTRVPLPPGVNQTTPRNAADFMAGMALVDHFVAGFAGWL